MKKWLVVVCVGLISVASIAGAAPKPAIVQGPGLWTAKVTYERLRPIMYQPSAQAPPQRYWYIILTIENPSDQDVQLFPKFDLVTDTIQVIPAGLQVPAGLYAQLLQSYARKFPLLEPLPKLMNQLASSKNLLRRGNDYAVDVLVVWPDFDPKASQVSLYFTGFSNETAVVTPPGAQGRDNNRHVYLRKTLALTYNLHSQSQLRNDVDAVFDRLTWVMR